jgi:hypothetical protein
MPDTFFVGDHAQMLPLAPPEPPMLEVEAVPASAAATAPTLAPPSSTAASASQPAFSLPVGFVPSLEHLYGLAKALPYAIPFVRQAANLPRGGKKGTKEKEIDLWENNKRYLFIPFFTHFFCCCWFPHPS